MTERTADRLRILIIRRRIGIRAKGRRLCVDCRVTRTEHYTESAGPSLAEIMERQAIR